MSGIDINDYEYIIEARHKSVGMVYKMLQWTTEPPTVEGWYWMYDESSTTEEAVCLFVYKDNGAFVVYKDDEETAPVSLFKYWLGPLPVPEPPTEDK